VIILEEVEHTEFKINVLIILVQGDEQLIFQLLNILLFQQLFLREYIQCSDLSIPLVCIQFGIQQHNNQSLFLFLEHIPFFIQLHTQLLPFHKEHIPHEIHL